MCSHYDPVLDPSRLKKFFGVDTEHLILKPSLWPGYFGPFIRKHEFADVGDEAVPENELMVGSFGLIPHWAPDEKTARKLYNARSETVHQKPSFSDSWKAPRHCIIPAEAIFEPDWRTGKAVPTRIKRTDGEPIGIAGLWAKWKRKIDQETIYSFTMLTLNADTHPFMRDYHKPENEKRMLVMLHQNQYRAWLNATPEESRAFITQFPAEMMMAEA